MIQRRPPQYKNVAFSKHARERMDLRIISDDMVLKAIQNPDQVRLEEDGDTKFIRKVNGVQLHVVCKPLPEEDKWLIKSTWVRGEDDYGNRVDRNGRRIGKVKRVVPKPGIPTQPQNRSMVVNGLLIAILIAVIIILIYLLTR